jgi:hypothetical protein
MKRWSQPVQIAAGIVTLLLAAPAHAGASSGMGAILVGAMLLGLLLAGALGWAVSLLSRDNNTRWLIRGAAVGAYLVWLVAFILGV